MLTGTQKADELLGHGHSRLVAVRQLAGAACELIDARGERDQPAGRAQRAVAVERANQRHHAAVGLFVERLVDTVLQQAIDVRLGDRTIFLEAIPELLQRLTEVLSSLLIVKKLVNKLVDRLRRAPRNIDTGTLERGQYHLDHILRGRRGVGIIDLIRIGNQIIKIGDHRVELQALGELGCLSLSSVAGNIAESAL